MKIGNMINKVSGVIRDKKAQIEDYQQKVRQSKIFNINEDIIINEDELILGNIYQYTSMCSYINTNQAKLIDALIPLNEEVIYIVHATQKVDNQELILVLTNIRVIIINQDKYTHLSYNDIPGMEIISNSLFTQIINFGGVILGIDLEQNDLNIFYNILSDVNYRNNYVNEKIKYLCGITPVYQKLNKINSGISIDQNNNIVFHDRKNSNYLYKYDDLVNYEVLEDNTPVIKRKTREQSHAMGFTKKECSKMTMRVTPNDGRVFEIEIIEPKVFGGSYDHNSSEYMKEYDFVKEIVDKLDSMNKDLL